MDASNLNILVEAKKEYMGQLNELMIPLMIETFHELYDESAKLANNKNTLMKYQTLLKEVPNWNNHMIKQHNTKLCNACAWFGDLLAAVFVSSVKILSSVRLNAENKKISLKLPSNEVFIHGCYVAAAKELYKDPYVFTDNPSEYDIEMNLTPRFRKCVDETVKNMIPVQHILHTYISQGEKMEEKDLEFETGEQQYSGNDEDDDPEMSGGEEEEEEAVSTPVSAPVGGGEEDNIKNISVNSAEARPAEAEAVAETEAEAEDGTLFPDAPDTLDKKS